MKLENQNNSSEVKGTKLETPAMPIAQRAQQNQLTGVRAKKIASFGIERTLLNIDTFSADGRLTGSRDETIDPYGRTAGLRVG